MRSEKEMLDLILNYANNDQRVRAVFLNGSRTNPTNTPDRYSDFDVVYIVNNLDSFTVDHNWVDYFGDRVIMQMPSISSLFPEDECGRFAYLMQFSDGNRIDLTLLMEKYLADYLKEDTLTQILLDKDSVIPALPLSSEKSHYVKKPTAQNFEDCVNEFWWVSPYVAKGLCRGEILYATKHLHTCLLEELLRMYGWQVGTENDFRVNLGSSYKFLNRYLPKETLDSLNTCYRQDTPEACWSSLFLLGRLFEEASQTVAKKLGFTVHPYEEKVTKFLKKMYSEK